jgi:hypothetical protein
MQVETHVLESAWCQRLKLQYDICLKFRVPLQLAPLQRGERVRAQVRARRRRRRRRVLGPAGGLQRGGGGQDYLRAQPVTIIS